MLYLFAPDDDSPLDVVEFDNNANGWPDDGMSSIYVKPGLITTFDNDDGSN